MNDAPSDGVFLIIHFLLGIFYFALVMTGFTVSGLLMLTVAGLPLAVLVGVAAITTARMCSLFDHNLVWNAAGASERLTYAQCRPLTSMLYVVLRFISSLYALLVFAIVTAVYLVERLLRLLHIRVGDLSTPLTHLLTLGITRFTLRRFAPQPIHQPRRTLTDLMKDEADSDLIYYIDANGDIGSYRRGND
ncbi:MAG: hypothetical protein OHK0046_20580 [Anaerolineae bacterium]